MKLHLALFFLLLSYPMFAADHEWRWIKVANIGAKGWDVSQGTALVTIDKDKFRAKLFWQDSADHVRITLSGTIKDGRIAVTETVEESDYTDRIISVGSRARNGRQALLEPAARSALRSPTD